MKLSIHKHIFLALIISCPFVGQAQLAGKTGSLMAADRAAARLSVTEGPHHALSSVIDKNSVFFTPTSVNAITYMANRPNIPDVLSWEPTMGAVSKSMDWGFTTGSLQSQRVGVIERYGEYLAIWKRNKKGEWKIDVRAEIEHKSNPKSNTYVAPHYIEPDVSGYIKHRSQVRLQQRTDVITSTDKLFATVLRADTERAYQEFLADDARFLYPWTTPIEGKENIIAYTKKRNIAISAQIEKADRAYSGDLAYSYGTATVNEAGEIKDFRYVRVWKLQSDFQWRVLVEMLMEL